MPPANEPDDTSVSRRAEAIRRIGLALRLVGASSVALLLVEWQADWWGVDGRERRIGLLLLSVLGLGSGALLVTMRRSIAARLVPILAVALNLATIAVLVVGVDVVRVHRQLGGGGGQQQEGSCFEPDAELGWIPKPGSVCRRQLEGNFDSLHRIDERGFKAVPSSGRPERRLFFFGDSFTFGTGVSNPEVFPNVIAREHLDERVQVVNAGVDGYGLVQMYGRLLREREALGPGDLVVFSPISLDLRRNAHDLEAIAAWILDATPEKADHFPIFVDGEIRVGRIRTPGNRVWAHLLSGPLTRGFFRFVRRALFAPPNVRQGHEILAAAREVVEERGARFAAFFLPRVSEIEESRYGVELSTFDPPDLRGYFPQEKDRLAACRFPDDAHWNPAGHRIAAGALVEELVAGGFLEPRYLRPDRPAARRGAPADS